ncbi:hypothetical protein PHOBOS_203 [Erwinia phage vB_EamM_Phobos]|uniref:hypothetical protein n=1 Tax=Erwinia phage vB_EamM_Phobos TaxID=1883377 RepID=UPI00081C4E4B|nr:hypothetical protein BIZ79_gp203 [Erwinia phage vB_EamM_Phobos]ANZ50393.1 hypothetical protein PHOBOS_203 [Erwinia phage vB_EamM_Phobos]
MQLIIDFRNHDVSEALRNLSNGMKTNIVMQIEEALGMTEIKLSVDTGNDHVFINNAKLGDLVDDVITRELQRMFGQVVTINTGNFQNVGEFLDLVSNRFGEIFTRLITEAQATELTAKMLVDGQTAGDYKETLTNLVPGDVWQSIEKELNGGRQQALRIMRTALESMQASIEPGSVM